MNIWWLLGALLISWTILVQGDSSAMTTCQQTHSYDVCFTELNR